ncbi:SusC/RagA family TonB-linked outer membrane protein [Pararcticibacter amylolyticus]|uniref:SusC/RagA family TonB-linked outer membrane protein n=1 Tax=Pararcticibacter amylolyticus TaxID=2173175 RepID=A0A2U2PJG3_9SPHI|nr:SusC/RagA family TonB-linked outer membrane protein [Pararcticibacter amylolyticus]PWG81546.1 SusC/RagA family TonB-linked outer membrane protein [Pararcticibacter amylolyticus]
MKKKIYPASLILQWRRVSAVALLFLSFQFAFAESYKEKDLEISKTRCSLNVVNMPLSDVLGILQKQTKFTFLCVDNTNLLFKKVNLKVSGKSLNLVLDAISKELDFIYRQSGNQISIEAAPPNASLNAVPQIIKGRVTDEKKESLPGVSVLIKGKNNGTITNQDGDFSIKASTGDILVFSFIGFQSKEVTVGSTDKYVVVLEANAKSLSEVVVTALGIRKEKAKLGYAVQEVQGENLIKAREPNLVNSLTGRVAGLNIKTSTDLFQDPGISLRGRKPLIVVDGIPDQTADLYRVNADDVESVTVLKGANASALYGSIGGNGAIMITTKRGKGKTLSVELNSSTQIQPSFIRIPKVQTEYGAGNNGQYTYVNGSGGGAEGSGWIWGPKLDQPDPTTPSGYFETPQFNSPMDPVTGKRIPIPFISRGKNNVKDFFNTGLISTNNISIMQSSDKGSFRASAAHIYQKGIVPNTDLNNSSFSVSGNYKLSDALTMDARLTYNRQYTDNFPEVGYGPTNYLYNLVLWTGADVSVKDLRDYWVEGQEGFQQRNYNTSYYNNPYFQAYEYLRGYDKDNTFGSLNLSYKISPDFSVQFRNGINSYGLNRTYKEPKSYIGYGKKSLGQFTIETGNYFDINTDLVADYNHTFTEKFKIHAQVGGSNYYRNQKYGKANTDGLIRPGFYNLSNSINPVEATNGLEERRTSSVYSVLELEFLNSVYVTATGRNDIISTLPISNNSFFYPSLNTSVIISQLLRLPASISYLKVRGGWSRVSSGTLRDAQYTYDYLPTFSKGVIWNSSPSLTYGDVLLSKELNPQTSDSWEIGLDTRLFDNRIGVEATYFQTRDFNNIAEIPMSVASAYNTQLVNGNVFQRKGLEFVLSGSPVRHEQFRWDVSVNLARYLRYLTDIYGDAPTLNNLKPGDRVDMIWGSVYQKDPDGNIIYGSNGFPVTDDFARPLGYRDPDWIYGMENTFSYKKLSFRFLVDGRIGGKMFSTTNQKMWWGGTHPGTVNQYREDANAKKATYVGPGVVVTGGQVTYDADGNITSDTRTFAPNTKAVNYIDYMTTTSNGANNDYNYFSQTFLKLREVTLTWQLPGQWLAKSFIKDVNVSAVGRNLLLFSKMPNVDPDPAADNLQTPSTRSFGLNLNVKF